MAEPWLKLDTSLTSNPKVMALAPETFKLWICVLVETKRYNEGGLVPPLPRLAYAVHGTVDRIAPLMDILIARRLVDRDGDTLMVHDWAHWQRPMPSETREAWAERQRRSRLSRPVTGVTTVTNGVTTRHDLSRVSRPRLEEIREEETREEEDHPPSPPAKRGERIPPDFTLTDAMAEYAAGLGIDAAIAADQVEGFRLHFEQTTKNPTSRDWVKRWQTSLRRDLADGRVRPSPRLVAPGSETPVVYEPTPPEAAYAELHAVLGGVLMAEQVSANTAAVAEAFGGFSELRAGTEPVFRDWLSVYNRVIGASDG